MPHLLPLRRAHYCAKRSSASAAPSGRVWPVLTVVCGRRDGRRRWRVVSSVLAALLLAPAGAVAAGWEPLVRVPPGVAGGVQGEDVSLVTLSPTLRGVVWVDQSQSCNGGLYRSVDAGRSWAQATPGVTSLALDANDPNLAWAVRGRDVVRTDDAGVTWTPTAYAVVAVPETDKEYSLEPRSVLAD